MEDIILELKKIEDEEIEFYNIKLPLLENEVLYNVAKIRECKELSFANKYFDILQQIQETFGLLLYKYYVNVSTILDDFQYRSDRLDANWSRGVIFQEIKSLKKINQPNCDVNDGIKNLNNFLKDIESDQTDLYDRRFPLVLQEIIYLFSKISYSDNFNEAKKYFDLLAEIHQILASLKLKYKITLTPDRLVKFLDDYKKINKIEFRVQLYNAIKKNNVVL